MWVSRRGELTNRKIQAQRLMEPQMPLRASRVVKWWLVAASMAAVNTACMLVVCTRREARTTRTVENNHWSSNSSALQTRLGKLVRLVQPQPLGMTHSAGKGTRARADLQCPGGDWLRNSGPAEAQIGWDGKFEGVHKWSRQRSNC